MLKNLSKSNEIEKNSFSKRILLKKKTYYSVNDSRVKLISKLDIESSSNEILSDLEVID